MDIPNYRFQGVWILPNGGIAETDDIQSHRAVLNRDDIRKLVLGLAEENSISTDDMTITAMKVGFIRILNYGNQVAVELASKPSKTQVDTIMEKVRQYRLNLYHEFAVIIDDFAVENIETNEVKMLHSTTELNEYLKSVS